MKLLGIELSQYPPIQSNYMWVDVSGDDAVLKVLNNGQYEMVTAWPAKEGLKDYLTKEQADKLYAPNPTGNAYLTVEDAEEKYLSKTDASSIYAKITDLPDLTQYITKKDVKDNYVSNSTLAESLVEVNRSIAKKQNILTPGTGISILNNVISTTLDLSPYLTIERAASIYQPKGDYLIPVDLQPYLTIENAANTYQLKGEYLTPKDIDNVKEWAGDTFQPLGDYALKEDLDDYVLSSVLDSSYQKILSEGEHISIQDNTISVTDLPIIKQVTPEGETVAASYELQDSTGKVYGARINILKNPTIKSIKYNEETKDLEFVFILNDNSEQPLNVPLDDLFNIYLPGAGILFTQNEDGSNTVNISHDTLTKIQYSDREVRRLESAKVPWAYDAQTQTAINIALGPKGKLLGPNIDKSEFYVLASIGIYGTEGAYIYQAEIGNVHTHLNLNSPDRPTVGTPEGKDTVVLTSDLQSYQKIQDESLETKDKTVVGAINEVNQNIKDTEEQLPHLFQIPVRTVSSTKVYSQEDIFRWLNVSDLIELKQLMVRHVSIINRWGLSLSGLPYYYRFPVEYVSLKSNNQIYLVFQGLDTSDDKIIKYVVTMNLDGTLIGNTQSNVQVQLIPIEDKDMSEYQLKTDNTLITESKEVTGAINEINTNVSTEITDRKALINKVEAEDKSTVTVGTSEDSLNLLSSERLQNNGKEIALKEDVEDILEPYTVNLTNLISAEDSESISTAIGGIDNLNATVQDNRIIVGTISNGSVSVSIRILGNVTTLYYLLDSVVGLTLNEVKITNTSGTLSKSVTTHSVLTENMVINSLNSDETTLPLSAAQGKALDNKINNINVSQDITNAINALDASGQTASTGEVISSVSQADGVISVQKKTLAENDIPTLSIAKINDLQTSLDAKQDSLTAGTGIEITEGNVINITLDTTVFFVAETAPVSPSEDQKKKICLVPADTTEEGNFYTEYVWVVDDTHPDGYWEEFGTYKSEVDLTSYLKTSDAESTYLKITDAESEYATKTELAGKQDAGNYVEDIGDSDNDVYFRAIGNPMGEGRQPMWKSLTTSNGISLTNSSASHSGGGNGNLVSISINPSEVEDQSLATTSKNLTGAINEVNAALYSPTRIAVSTLFADSATITSGLSSQIAAYGESTAADFPLMYAGASIGNIKPTWIRTSAGVTNFMCIADNKIWYFEIQGTTVQRTSLAIS